MTHVEIVEFFQFIWLEYHESVKERLRVHPESFRSSFEIDEECNLTGLQINDYVLVKFIVNPPSDIAHSSKA